MQQRRKLNENEQAYFRDQFDHLHKAVNNISVDFYKQQKYDKSLAILVQEKSDLLK